MVEEDDVLELARNQGASRQLRILEAMPAEIASLLAAFAEADRKAEELERAKHQHAERGMR
jgi:hypothetical protein